MNLEGIRSEAANAQFNTVESKVDPNVEAYVNDRAKREEIIAAQARADGLKGQSGDALIAAGEAKVDEANRLDGGDENRSMIGGAIDTIVMPEEVFGENPVTSTFEGVGDFFADIADGGAHFVGGIFGMNQEEQVAQEPPPPPTTPPVEGVDPGQVPAAETQNVAEATNDPDLLRAEGELLIDQGKALNEANGDEENIA